MLIDKKIRLIGLANRAGKVRAGTFITEKLVKEGKAPFVVVANDGSEKQKEKLLNLLKFYNTDYIIYGTKEELGQILGKEETMSLVITDINFINGIKN
ncbi:MAG: ribosomal L7Ae/L30e/S12e/Gadd45 family protein [Clostridia bacterium]|nr:ribosomal L7Ae/L30e/S12e/Gadd45 family protein [Clostridia bacterium]